MASLGLWRARLQITQRKCSQDTNRSVFTMKSIPGNSKRKPKKRNRCVERINSLPTSCNASNLSENHCVQQKEEPVPKTSSSKNIPSKPSSASQLANDSGTPRFGEGIIPAEELERRRVRQHPSKKSNRWVSLLKKDLESYQRTLAEKRAAKLAAQREFGNTLRRQIEENNHKAEMERKRRQEEAEQLAKEIKEKEKEKLQKLEMQKQSIAKNCSFISEQLKARREAAERAERNKQQVDLLAREALRKKIEKEKQLAEEARRRIREDLQQYRTENERNMKEKAKLLAEERRRDIEEQKRNIAAMEAIELEKQAKVKMIADKTAALEKESEKITKIMQAKLEEDERRIKRYQEECDEKEKRDLLERKKKQKAIIEDMKHSIQLQLDERRQIQMNQAEEAKRMAITARELATQEMKRLRDEDRKVIFRKRQYKTELEKQIQLRDEINQSGLDDMNENELAINRNLLS